MQASETLFLFHECCLCVSSIVGIALSGDLLTRLAILALMPPPSFTSHHASPNKQHPTYATISISNSVPANRHVRGLHATKTGSTELFGEHEAHEVRGLESFGCCGSLPCSPSLTYLSSFRLASRLARPIFTMDGYIKAILVYTKAEQTERPAIPCEKRF